MKRPLILISNDDGYQAKGIRELVRMIRHHGDVIVCAPEGARSGKSRAFTMDELTLRPVATPDADAGGRFSESWYACSGTPVDCVKIAFWRLCPRRPDLILGGINHGDNASTNAHYSGTVGIAFEGAIKDIPSIAFSLCDYDADADFSCMEPVVQRLCEHALQHGMPKGTFLNVNVPKAAGSEELKGIRMCRMSRGEWLNEVEQLEERTDEHGNPVYVLRGYYNSREPEAADTDAWALRNGYVAVTPATIDITSYDFPPLPSGW